MARHNPCTSLLPRYKLETHNSPQLPATVQQTSPPLTHSNMPRHAKPTERPLPDRTLVLDNGAYTIKAGFATDAPDTEKDCHLLPNCIARARDKRVWIGGQLEHCKDFGEMAFRRPVE